MRVFPSLSSLIEEIRRDLVKSQPVNSSRVQNEEVEQRAFEALNYQYSISSTNMPGDHYQLAQIGVEYFQTWSDAGLADMTVWLEIEAQMRINPLSLTSVRGGQSETRHPSLTNMAEGHHWAYTYRERCIGLCAAVTAALETHRDSRRAFFPIFQPLDAIRAPELTRIPCTIGYHFLVRDVPLLGPKLHVTNIQRSCDYNQFLLSDLWFTHMLQKEIARRLQIDTGMITHSIISLHAFIDEEIY